MKRIVTTLLTFTPLLLAAPLCRAQQASSAVQFLDGLAAAPASDRNAENEKAMKQAEILTTALRADVEASLPAILLYAENTSQNERTRKYAALFLAMIGMRGDGRDLLSTHSADIAQLLTDADPGIQRAAVTITYGLIGPNAGQQSAAYVPALAAAVRNPGTPQDIAVQMLDALLRLGSGQTAIVESVHNFLTRPDLNPQTKIDSVRSLGMLSDLPEQISQDLCTRFDDPNPNVRIAAIIAYSNAASQKDNVARYVRGEVSIPSEDPQEAALRRKAATSVLSSEFTFVGEARKHVERIAADETENPKLRQLARDALAGRTPLNPNILEPNVVDPEGKPINPR